MAETKKPNVTKAEIENSQALWTSFTEFMKWGVIAVIVVLALMAAFLL